MDLRCEVRLSDGGIAVSAIGTNLVQVFSLTNRVDPAHVPKNTSGATPLRSIGQTAGFISPMGLATDGTHLFVADCANNRVQQLRISDGAVVD